jgi:hypothetical protein
MKEQVHGGNSTVKDFFRTMKICRQLEMSAEKIAVIASFLAGHMTKYGASPSGEVNASFFGAWDKEKKEKTPQVWGFIAAWKVVWGMDWYVHPHRHKNGGLDFIEHVVSRKFLQAGAPKELGE